MMLSTSPEAPLEPLSVPPAPLTLTTTCFDQAPLPGVCATTVSVCAPAGIDAATTPENPADANAAFPSTSATSGRLKPTLACASTLVPSRTWTSSIPAQPSALVSTTHPLIGN